MPGAPYRIDSNETSLHIGFSAPQPAGMAFINHFVVEADEVEGLGVANQEQWVQVC